jgi:hypothetical protein
MGERRRVWSTEDAHLLEEKPRVVTSELSGSPEEGLFSGSEPLADRARFLRHEPAFERLRGVTASVRIAQDALQEDSNPEVTMHRRTSGDECPRMLPAEAAGSGEALSRHWIVDLLPEERL